MPSGTERASDQPKVSVVIPVFNGVPFVERAIRSAMDQTYRVAEIIVVDDASTDSTIEAVEALAKDESRIKLIRLSANGGPAKARNAGFAAAIGDWIAVLDADDAFLAHRLSHLMLKSSEADILADDLLYYDPTTDTRSEPFGRKPERWETVDLVTFADSRRDHSDFGLFKPVFRRQFLEKHRVRYPEHVRHGEDFVLAFEAIARGARYWLSWRPGYLYTTRLSGWSRTRVDYATMGTDLEALARRDDLQLSPAVRARLTHRIVYTSHLHARHQLISAIEDRRVGDAFLLAARNPRLWPLIARRLYFYVAKTLGLGGDQSLQRKHRLQRRGSKNFPEKPTFKSAEYWESRYRTGGTSGAGSYNRLAKFKAKVLNQFVGENRIRSVIEFGSGDGAQLELAKYPSYVGVDVSETIVAIANERFRGDPSKSFLIAREVSGDTRAELALSLDVIYHLIEDGVFESYMCNLFDAATRFVIVYSSNHDAPTNDEHVRHRCFTRWVEAERPDFSLVRQIPNEFPFDEDDQENSSFADFYIFRRA